MKEEDIVIGKKVYYYPTIGWRKHIETTITSEPWECCGSLICKVDGVSGGVNIENLFDSEQHILEAKEIQIGDYLSSTDRLGSTLVGRVDTIVKEINWSETHVRLYSKEKGGICLYNLLHLMKPIPITDDIMEENGWKIEELADCSYWWHRDVPFDIPRSGFEHELSKGRMFCNDFFEKTFIAISFVHELQQALRLVGLKEIEDKFTIKEGVV